MENTIINEEKYKEVGIFSRFGKMLRGFSSKTNTKEYKEALIELQRLSAPLTAVIIPTLVVAILIVVSAVSSTKKQTLNIDIAQNDEQVEELDELPPPPEPITVEETEIDPTIVTDTPYVGDPSEIAQESFSPDNNQQTAKVNDFDAVMMVKSVVTMKSVYGSRSTGKRGSLTGGGSRIGDQYTEAAVMKALRWLKHTQHPDGSWAEGDMHPSMTGFALLSYLAHGETPSSSKEFGYTVKRGIDYLLDSVQLTPEPDVKATGIRGQDGNQYTFPIVTYALCEAYGMTRNPDIKDKAEKCLERIIDCQSSTGGWDYGFKKSSNRDDTSLGGWCVQALKAGKMAGLHPEGMEECIRKAINCYKTRCYSDKLGFKYTASEVGGGGLAGVGCLAMQLLGYSNQPEVRNALNVMRDWLPSFDHTSQPNWNKSPQYYCYYATQCKYQAGMAKGASLTDAELWKKWNAAMKKLYPPTIITLDEKIEDPNGNLQEMGYWQNNDEFRNDKTMGTCLAALQLMVYYRYLPTTSLKATEVEVDIAEAAKDDDEIGVQIDL